MQVTRGQIITRGLAHRCPNCGGHALFKPGTLFELNGKCPDCGLKFEKDDGFYLGAMALNYGVTLFAWLLPLVVLWYNKVLGDRWTAGLAITGAIVVPALLYRSSRSWQLMLYYSFFPQHLPRNRTETGATGDENT